MMQRLVLNEMIWTEVEKELDNIKVAVVPVGSCEQHGPNTTFDTDTARAYEFSKLLGDRMGNKILIYPPITYGLSYHHMDFPGTVTLRFETMLAVLTDVALSITKHGIKKILFINGHGGNRTALSAVVIKLKQEFDIDAYWSGMGTPLAKTVLVEEFGELPSIIGHACEVETSQSMYLAPWIVRENRVLSEMQDSIYTKKLFVDGSAAWNWKKHASNNGALGDARRATKEIGKKMTDKVLEYMEELVNKIIKL